MFASASRPLARALSSAVARRAAPSSSNLAASSRILTPSLASRPAFSTSSWRHGDSKVEQKKEEEAKIAGESMGAQDSADAGAELEAQVKEKDARIKELQDQILYGKADYQNLQRRALEEKTQAGDYAISRLAKDLVSTLDILHLALKSVPEQFRKPVADAQADDPRKVIADLYSGVDLTSKSLLDTLKTHGVTQFDPTGEKFDPKEHEALYQAPVPGKEPGSVLECSKVGYRIKDRLLRAAEVGVVQG
ncbi:GrpE-domain-containing protein [Violaceomyces palustris]|uniref:GrpE-domain-containing protein n=1 Tax=Violaceomyces palustris TaxID=1673888 RepID=A0ACD0P5E3_9BASI|nr:GrpE-domain-containing protein [Violaceomyces palustris]